MSDVNAISQLPVEEQGKRRRKYRKPRLEKLGDLRTLTLGGSPGLNDSGSQFTHKPPGTMPQPDGFPFPPDGPPKDGWPPK